MDETIRSNVLEELRHTSGHSLRYVVRTQINAHRTDCQSVIATLRTMFRDGDLEFKGRLIRKVREPQAEPQ